MPTRPDRCPNCQTELTGQFCARCGQNNRYDRLELKELVGSAFEHLTELEVPIFRTLVGLTLRPGKTCREYVQGMRKKYTNPFKFYFIALTLFVLTITLLSVRVGENTTRMLGFGTMADPPAQDLDGNPAQPPANRPSRVTRAVGDSTQLGGMVESSLTYLGLLAMPFSALALKLMFRRSGYNYTEHLVFVMYSLGYQSLLSTVFSAIGAYQYIVLFCLHWICLIVYATWSASGFYKTPVWSTVPRAFVLLLVDNLVAAFFGTVMVTLIVVYRMLTMS